MSSISDRYALSSRFWLNFTSPGVEKDYVGEIASKNSFQIKLSSSLLILFSILLQVIFPKPLGFTLFIRVSIVFASILLLMTPKRYQEYAVVGVETCMLVIGLVCNRFRLLRHSITDEQSNADYDKVWADCNDDLAIHTRDAIEVLLVLGVQIPFVFFRARTKISWIPPATACVAFSSLLTVPSLRLDDGGGTTILFQVLFFASGLLWLLCVFIERDHRGLWAMNRKREQSLMILDHIRRIWVLR